MPYASAVKILVFAFIVPPALKLGLFAAKHIVVKVANTVASCKYFTYARQLKCATIFTYFQAIRGTESQSVHNFLHEFLIEISTLKKHAASLVMTAKVCVCVICKSLFL